MRYKIPLPRPTTAKAAILESGSSLRPARLEHAVRVLRDGLAEGAAPGGVVCAYRKGEIFLHEAFGTRDGEGEHPVTTETRYDLASLTKPLATAATLVRLVEDGVLSLQSRASPYFDGIAADDWVGVTIGHLLTHTSGLPAWAALYENGLGADAAVDAALRVPRVAPGTIYTYSCLGFILLQRILETATGKPLDALAREYVLEPLGMSETGYSPNFSNAEHVANIAPTIGREGHEKKDIALTGIVHDGNARAIGGVSGNAGLFGTAADVALFGEAVRAGKLFGTPATERALTNQIYPTVGAHTLLFYAQGNAFCPTGDLLSPRAIGHSGFTGTVLLIDPAYDLTVAVLTNAVYGDGKAQWLPLRRRFVNALAGAID